MQLLGLYQGLVIVEVSGIDLHQCAHRGDVLRLAADGLQPHARQQRPCTELENKNKAEHRQGLEGDRLPF